MKIAIDVSPLTDGNAARGVGFYTRFLTDQLKTKNDGNEYILVKNKSEIENIKPDLIHYPFFDLFFQTLPERKNIPVVVTIHDVIPLVFPELFPVGIKGKINLALQKRRLQKVDMILTDSMSSKRDIHNILGIPNHKIEAVYLGCDPSLHPETDSKKIDEIKQKYNLPEKYILKVGDINKHKNFHILFDAISRVQDTNLVLVGKALALDAPKIPELKQIEEDIQNFSLTNRVFRLGFVDSEDMSALFSGAQALIQNSIYEGFGLPALESMTCGTPVIAGDNSSLSEIVGNSGILIDANDVLETTKAIEKVISLDKDQYSTFKEKSLAQAKKFSVKKMTEETIEVYNKVLNN